MRVALLILIVLTGCEASEPAARKRAAAVQSACSSRIFEGSRFTICAAKGAAIEVFTADASGTPYRSFSKLEAALGDRATG